MEPEISQDAEHARIEKQRGNRLTALAVVFALLYVALFVVLALRATPEERLEFIGPGSSPPCFPPADGYWPNCREKAH
ncbi:MAG TPA: hypothetical protein VKY85_26175 [Candidatus Angelobacter sp.]|nr:hypothetical protein [Candidatus Angelobacter sp.]